MSTSYRRVVNVPIYQIYKDEGRRQRRFAITRDAVDVVFAISPHPLLYRRGGGNQNVVVMTTGRKRVFDSSLLRVV
jgi:hypothetical protein